MRSSIFIGLSIALVLLSGCGDISKEVSQNKVNSIEEDNRPLPGDTTPIEPEPIISLTSLGSCNRSASSGHCEDYAIPREHELDELIKKLGGNHTKQQILDEYLASLESDCLDLGGIYKQDECPENQRSHLCKYNKNIPNTTITELETDRVYYHDPSIQAYMVSDRVTTQQLVFNRGRWVYRLKTIRSAQAQDERVMDLVGDFCSDLDGAVSYNINP